ncbi:MAG TPA: ribonuclease P protein component [Candidatus Acidoferrum sp.]|nr:ribonuclease P protein component [Candidatus Acidoferrum sp.]
MLQTRFRFHGYNGLKYLFKQGKTVRARSMALRYAQNPRRTDSRCAVVVAKKVLKSAPKRNRVRRRIYEVIRTQWLSIAPGYDLLFTVYEPHLWDMPAGEVSKAIIGLLQQAKLWRMDTSPVTRAADQTDALN